MAFLEQRLREQIERGATGGPVNRGRKRIVTTSGKLRQLFQWAAPLHEYEIGVGVVNPEDFEALRAMWYVVQFTPYEGFRFRDWTDYQATKTNTTLVFVSGTNWQLYRTYTFAGVTFSRKITKPNSGVTVYRTRSAVESTATATITTSTGIAAITGHVSGDTYTWTGTFDVPVTFADDEWVATVETANGQVLPIAPSIKVVEVPA